jgi:type IV pilus assembly protein PilM
MAVTQGVWGIDIGQCALKALRCVPSEDPKKVTAEAFDYIEYPKILSQPEANPDELIADAIQQFLSRNEIKGDRVAISVPGQNGLARFIKLPPVEQKKIPEIVRYEARQQIPFDLDDVIWDYQQMPGGMIEEGYALETEVGLFAMKREQVYKMLRPFDRAGVEVDVVQLTPLALYNLIAFDQMRDLPPDDLYDADNPPESLLVLSLGTDTTELVITNGFRVWQRSLPIGGNHFTKALTKELKQTFAKAEHIKRNAAHAENPKAIFQAMRPVFQDLVTEVQRSINFFSNVDRKAKVGRGIALGNTAKLPGLIRFLSQNLKLPINRLESYNGLDGPGIVEQPAFKENMLSFGVCYGLCLQGLTETRITTNLIPPEIVKDRLIRAKKPWAVAAAAALLLGLSVSFLGTWNAWATVRDDRWQPSESTAQSFVSWAQSNKQQFDTAKKAFDDVDLVGKNLVPDVEKRVRWLKLLQAVSAALPRDPPGKEPTDPALEEKLYIEEILTSKQDLATWFVNRDKKPVSVDGSNMVPPGMTSGGVPGTVPGVSDAGGAQTTQATTPATLPPDAPKGEGWVITIRGYHFHNVQRDEHNQGAAYVNRTFIKNLQQDELPIQLPGQPDRIIPVKKLGIAHPILINPGGVDWEHMEPNPDYDPLAARNEGNQQGGTTNPQGANPKDGVADPKKNEPAVPPMIKKPIFRFEVQFCWVDEPPATATQGPQVAQLPGGTR